MSILSVWLASQEEKNKGMRMMITVLWFLVLALAIYLAIKDMNLLTHTSTKIWVFALAIAFPELFIVLTGISTSSMGVSFFSGSPVESSMSSNWFKPKGKSWGRGSKAAAAMDIDASSSLGGDMGGALPKAPDMSTPLTDTSSSLF
jgi:hypothetical protein